MISIYQEFQAKDLALLQELLLGKIYLAIGILLVLVAAAFFEGVPLRALGFMLATILLWPTWWALQRPRTLLLSFWLFAFCIWLAITVGVLTRGGIYSHFFIYWYCLLVSMALLLGGMQFGLHWGLVVTITILSFVIIEGSGHSLP